LEYIFTEIEKRWQQYWAEKKTFRALNPDDPEYGKRNFRSKYYVLDMFPYPSGAGLHVGHPLGYIASDIVARYKRHCGYNVLHPMGYDSFGLPAEQYAIQTGQHPALTTEQNIKRYREQLDKIGFSFDWDREVKTSAPDYYKWTQWIFLKLFNSWYNPETDRAEPIDTLIPKLENFTSLSEKEQSDVLMNYRLAYLSEAWVNWCPALGTVLANDEVKDGVSERGGHPVERKLMPQWSLRITAYAERLLNDLETIDWSESIKEAQRNWIGKSEGSTLQFKIHDSQLAIDVFTTRPDTIYGVTFLTLAPEHELAEKIATDEFKKAVAGYIHYAKNRSERERQAEVKKITGQFTGTYAIHPFTGELIPIWIAEYVLSGYGTGAVMGVPSHDTRDCAFAKHFNLPFKKVIQPDDPALANEECFDTYDGTCINSPLIDGLPVKEAIKKIIVEIEKRGVGKRKINYRLRDAVFGRQRYWGEPIPVYYENGIPKAVDEKDLPVILPEVDKYLPTETGEPPLARAAATWKYKGRFEFEKTTMPGWAGSSWYFLRYMDAGNKKAFAAKEALDYWNQIDLYIGGAEHATGHLLYFRFWTKFLKDLGYISFDEPAKKLINQGMIQGVSEKVFKPRDVSSGTNGRSSSGNPIWYIRTNIPEMDASLKNFEISSNKIALPIDESYFDNFRIEVFISSELVKEEWKEKVFQVNLDSRVFENSRLNLHRYIEMERRLNRNSPQANHLYVFISSDGVVIQLLHDDLRGIPEGFRFYAVPEVEKMSKSKRNVITPDTDPETGQPGILEQYGADCLRMYEMFLGPLEQHKPWNTNGITGVFNFLKKFWRLYHASSGITADEPSVAALKTLHRTIKKITDDIEQYSFNTAVSAFMICVNELTELKCHSKKILEPLCILISPFAPHLAEELWQNKLGHSESVTFEKWPAYKERYLVEDSYEYPVSINGKTRFKISLSLKLSKEEVEQTILAADEIKKYTQGNHPKKVIVVPGRIVNVVI
jgi:leucyl-tRNA synthetase